MTDDFLQAATRFSKIISMNKLALALLPSYELCI